MPRKRNPENDGLPKRWRLIRGAYYFDVPRGLESQWDGYKLFPLGKTLADAYRAWAARIEEAAGGKHSSFADLFDRYLAEVVPQKAAKTQAENVRAIKRLRSVFGDMPITALVPRHVYQYVDKRQAKVAAHREVEVLSHALTKAVSWGWIDRHPIKGEVRLEMEAPRDRYVEDWEIVEALSLSSVRRSGSVLMVQAYIRLKLLTGYRRADLLTLRVSDLHEDGIHVQPRKTAKTSGVRRITAWDMVEDENGVPHRELGLLWRAVDDALAARPVDVAPWLFCNSRGESYFNEEKGTANGFDSIWQRFMDRVLSETKVKERFTEHDLRAKVGSDAETLERAQALLAHASSATTKRVYRRRPEVVAPGRGVIVPVKRGGK